MGQNSSKQYTIEGEVKPGFEPVKESFKELFETGAEDKCQLCVYVGEEKVVDLWGQAKSAAEADASFTGDTLTTVFSSTKSLTAIVMGMAQDRGLLAYSDRISKHWPEFGAQGGKEEITVADLMRHEAGLSQLGSDLELNFITVDGIKRNLTGAVIEASPANFPAWNKEGKRHYHAFTRGWVANEVFRRVEPEHQTIGEYLQKHVAGPLGGARAFIGSDDPDYVPVHPLPLSRLLSESMQYSMTGNALFPMSTFRLASMIGNSLVKPPPFNAQIKDCNFNKDMNKTAVRIAEMPSVNGNCSARGLAVIAAAMANGGAFNNVRIMSAKAWDALHAHPTKQPIFPAEMDPYGSGKATVYNFTQGGVNLFEGDDRDGFYGWFGYGGSVFQWHPQLKIGFAFTCTMLHALDLNNQRGARLQKAVTTCVELLSKAKI